MSPIVNKAIKLIVAILIITISAFFITCKSPTESDKPQLNIQRTFFELTKNRNSDVLIISNSGNGELSWEFTERSNWLDVSKNSGNVTTDNDTIVFTVNFNMEARKYTGTISIDSNGGDEGITISFDNSIWVGKSNMPTARGATAAGTVNNKIYVIGGHNGTDYTNTIEEYDPITNTWTAKTTTSSMPYPRGDYAGCAVNGKIYAIGGWNRPNITYDIVEEYDPATNTWTAKAPIPTARWGHSLVILDGNIYVVGGATGWPIDRLINNIEIYNPSTDTWTAGGTNIPTPRWMPSCNVVNEKIYVIGGNTVGSSPLSTVEEYDPATDNWTTKSPMPTARGGLSQGTVNGKIYAIAGSNGYPGTIAYNTVEEYDPVTDSWSTKTPMPVGSTVPSTGVVNGKLYVIGGMGPGSASPDNVLADVYEYEPGLE